MANIKSQMKRIRTNEKARLRNRSVKSELKTFMRKAHEAVVAGDKIAAESALRVTTHKLGVVASKRITHKSQTARRKSKLATSMVAMN